jgi:hypothetical protein
MKEQEPRQRPSAIRASMDTSLNRISQKPLWRPTVNLY